MKTFARKETYFAFKITLKKTQKRLRLKSINHMEKHMKKNKNTIHNRKETAKSLYAHTTVIFI